MNHMRVLVAEDTDRDFETVKSYLEAMKADGFLFDIVRTSDGPDALSLMRNEDFDLAILDMCLPRKNGRAILKDIRRHKPFLPIVAISSYEGDVGEAETLNLGADDFLAKSFSERTFRARVKKAIWHGSLTTMEKSLSWGNVHMAIDTRTAEYRGKRLALTDYEFNILLTLVQAQGHIVEANALERAAWGNIERLSMRLANKIKTLRNKFEAFGAPREIIDTNRGMGYVLRDY